MDAALSAADAVRHEPDGGGVTRRLGFGTVLAGIAVLGFVLRALYAYGLVRSAPLVGDGLEFHLQANFLAEGRGYVQPFLLQQTGVARPSADKPPLFPMLEAGLSLAGGRSWPWHHLVGVVAGTGTVATVGLLGRAFRDAALGLTAAGLAAISPILIAADGSLRSESVYALSVALALLAALHVRARPGPWRAAALGAAIALAALSRGEALLLVLLLVLPLAGWRRTGVAATACVVVLAPWLVRCWVAFGQPVLVSTNVGGLLAGANCDRTYAGPLLGQWDLQCIPPPVHVNEARESLRLRGVGFDYARAHAGRLPIVLAARLGRTLELFRPRQNADMEAFYEGRNLRVAQAGVLWWYVIAVLTALGARAARRRGEPWAALLAPMVVVVVISLLAYGFTRFRTAVEPGVLVLAAVPLLALRARLQGAGTGGESIATRARALAASAGS